MTIKENVLSIFKKKVYLYNAYYDVPKITMLVKRIKGTSVHYEIF